MLNQLRDIDVENLILLTKGYTQTGLINWLKQRFGKHHAMVANQILLFDKAQKKLPQWVKQGCFFTPKSLEQCSSPALAQFKANMFFGNTIVDLCAGLGVDDVHFSQKFKQVIAIDADEELNELVNFNLIKLGVKNITRVTNTAEEYLKTVTSTVDLIYVDADRRVEAGAKSFSLTQSSPNVIELMPDLLKRSKTVLLKLSPLIDITYLRNSFLNIKNIFVVGIHNEVKEVLVELTANHETTHALIKAIAVNDEGEITHCVSIASNSKNNEISSIVNWFYEPSNMVIKAGLVNELAAQNGLKIVSKNSHYMEGAHLVENYFGRSFSIVTKTPYSKSKVVAYLKHNNMNKANVSARNFVTTVVEIRKTFSLKDGGDDYLFFTVDNKKQKWFYHCIKPNQIGV